jgi:8-oxo-dGTP diphosphatase
MRTNNYCYEYPRPALTVDAFILAFIEGKIRILLIKRADEPIKITGLFRADC